MWAMNQRERPAGVSFKLMPEGSVGVNQAKCKETMFQAQVTACAKFLRQEVAQPMEETKILQVSDL